MFRMWFVLVIKTIVGMSIRSSVTSRDRLPADWAGNDCLCQSSCLLSDLHNQFHWSVTTCNVGPASGILYTNTILNPGTTANRPVNIFIFIDER